MPLYNTITYSGVEKTFANWGVEHGTDQLILRNQSPDTFSFVQVGKSLTATPDFAFEGVITVKSDRTSTNGSDDSFSDGIIEFVGKRLNEVVDCRPAYEGVRYTFAGPWYDLEHTMYLQRRAYLSAGVVTHQLLAEIILFTKLDGSDLLIARNSGQQISDALQALLDAYTAQSLSAPFQIGTISPALNFPSYIAKPMLCADVIRKCLEFSPDCKVWFDYTFSPPKVHCRPQSALTPASLAFKDGTEFASVRIEPRPDLQLNSVVLFFKITGTLDGQVYEAWAKDKYGPHGANSGSDPDVGLRVLVETVDLVGFSQNQITAQLDCEALACGGGSHSTRRAWWNSLRGGEEKQFDGTKVRFQDTAGSATSIPSVTTAIDDEGNSVDLTDFPYRLIDGIVQPWMKLEDGTQVTAKRVRIKMTAEYSIFDVDASGGSETATNGNRLKHYTAKDHHIQITVTNGITDTYHTTASEQAGESVPSGLAQAIYTSLATLQYEGEGLKIATSISGGLSMANSLNITGGRTAWSSMAAQIQQLTKCFSEGTVTANIGPARHLNSGELLALLNMWAFRRQWQNPLVRQTGQTGSSGDIEITKNAPKGNTMAGVEVPAKSSQVAPAASANITRIEHDAVNQTLTIHVVNSSGVYQSAPGRIVLDLPTIAGHDCKMRLWAVPNDDDGACDMVAYFLSSEKFTPP